MNYIIHNISKGKALPGERYEAFGLELEACNFYRGQLLLNMRDGPRGRAPATRFAMGYGLVTLKQKSSLSLCATSVSSMVYKIIEDQKRTRQNGENYALNSRKLFRRHCPGNGRWQEENFERISDEGLIMAKKFQQAVPETQQFCMLALGVV